MSQKEVALGYQIVNVANPFCIVGFAAVQLSSAFLLYANAVLCAPMQLWMNAKLPKIR